VRLTLLQPPLPLFDQRLTDQQIVDGDALSVDDGHEVRHVGLGSRENDQGVLPAEARRLDFSPTRNALAAGISLY
jgi:hypothetical protein